MKLVRVVFGDPGLKVLSLLLAWALWYIVREDLTETATREATVVVEVEGDGDLSARPNQRTVTIQASGPRRALEAFRGNLQPRVVARIRADALESDQYDRKISFSQQELELRDSLGNEDLTIQSMIPATVDVVVFRVEQTRKTVEPPDFLGIDELDVRVDLKRYTTEAVVRGAANALSTIPRIKTFVSKEQIRSYAAGLRDTLGSTVVFRLNIDPKQAPNIELIEPKELEAQVQLSRVEQHPLEVPLQLYGDVGPSTAGGNARRLRFAEINKPHLLAGDPPRVQLVLIGPPAAVERLTPESIRAFVLTSDLPPDQTFGDIPVHIADLPPGVALDREYTVSVEEIR